MVRQLCPETILTRFGDHGHLQIRMIRIIDINPKILEARSLIVANCYNLMMNINTCSNANQAQWNRCLPINKSSQLAEFMLLLDAPAKTVYVGVPNGSEAAEISW